MNQLQLQQQQQQRQQRQQQQQDAAGGDGDAGAAGGEDDADADEAAAVDWQQHPEHTGAIVVHHETILKLKRILLTYMYVCCCVWGCVCACVEDLNMSVMCVCVMCA